MAKVTAERAQQEARQQKQDWQEHLERAAYDHAHPEVIAARKAATEAKAKHDADVRVAQRRRNAALASEKAHEDAEAAEAARVAHANPDSDSYHGYVIAKDDTEYFPSEIAYCEHVLSYAHRLVDIVQHQSPEEPEPEGSAVFRAGTRVSLVGHLHTTCSFDDDGYGHLAKQWAHMNPDLTQVTIHDGSVDQDGHTGYINEGELAKR